MTRIRAVTVNMKPPAVFAKKTDAAPKQVFFGDVFVEITHDGDADWKKVDVFMSRTAQRRATTGWMPAEHLDVETPPLEVGPVDKAEFVDACVRQEIDGRRGGRITPGVVAEYLIALALIESDLEDFGPRLPGFDGAGPYQIDSARWAAVAPTIGLRLDQRSNALHHVAVAAEIARTSYAAFSAIARPDGETAPDGPFVPSFLNLFHAWLIGVDAAVAAERAMASGDGERPMAGIVGEHHDALASDLIKARSRFLIGANRKVVAVGTFFQMTRRTLDAAMETAGKLLVEHRPDFVVPAEAAPWMRQAEIEYKFWKEGGLDENAARGAERVIAYFASIGVRLSQVEHWCGAFVGHCLAASGDARAAASLVDGPARAANWTEWGDVRLPLGAPETWPRGAVIVTAPLSESTSGHVAFFDERVEGESTIIVLGGNQSDSVTKKSLDLARVVAALWLRTETADVAAPDAFERGPGHPSAATDHDVLTLARTLYGEARGDLEDHPEAVDAVASVILNRLAARRFPRTVAGVCLQPFQFSCWLPDDPNFEKIKDLKMTSRKLAPFVKIARRAVTGEIADAVGGACHYHAASLPRARMPKWALDHTGQTHRLGGHVFYVGVV